jgi:hypothetical protein
MNPDVLHLLNLLEEEFRGTDQVTITAVFPSGVLRSPDLAQDYDPETGTVHLNSGVRIRSKRREYFFPSDWINNGRERINRQIEEIREHLNRELRAL